MHQLFIVALACIICLQPIPRFLSDKIENKTSPAKTTKREPRLPKSEKANKVSALYKAQQDMATKGRFL